MSRLSEVPGPWLAGAWAGALASALAVACLTSPVAAQRPRIEAPLIAPGPIGQDQKRAVEEGAAVQMFESPNVDRFLHKAQDFLQREDWLGAIRVLQDVLEGKTLLEPEEEKPKEPEPKKPDPKADPKTGTPTRPVRPPNPQQPETVQRIDPLLEENPANSVFSADRRLYRPVRRLCHELLAAMAEAGQILYREKFEFQAQQLLDQALALRDRRGLEEIYQKHFITLAAGRALLAAGDLLMAEGRHRAAIQSFRLLLEIYPANARKRIGELNETYVRLRIVACHQLLGDRHSAGEALAELIREQPDATVRLQGELVPLTELAQSELFGATLAAPAAAASDPTQPTARDGLALVPLWEHRFATQDPYRSPRGNDRQGEVFMAVEVASRAVPQPRQSMPGTSVAFVDGQILFTDHFRLRAVDALRGIMLAEGDGPLEAPQPLQNRARSRVPVYDWFSLRPVVDDQQVYFVLGHRDRRLPPDMQPVLNNELVAMERGTLKPVWSSSTWNAGREGARVTFLATPTPFGELLLVPVLDRGAYGLLGLDAKTGAVRFRTLVHGGGSDLVRAPAPPVQVSGGVAFVLTNAGVLAALDAYTGSLLWARRYERSHPFRPLPAQTRATNRNAAMMGGPAFREVGFTGFVPGDVHLRDGRVIFAPGDGKVAICLDGASGEPLWMVSKAVTGTHQQLLGCNRTHMFLAGAMLTCVDHRTGISEWELEIDGDATAWYGRGVVTDDWVVLPGDRCLRVLSLRGKREWRKVALPAFTQSDAPLSGPCNVFLDGPYLAVAYEAGIELYADVRALQESARASTDPLERASLLVQAGDLMGAIDALEAGLRDADEAARPRIASRIVTLAREAALTMVTLGARGQALELLGRVRPHAEAGRLLGQWHLARLEAFKALQDEDAMRVERQAIANWMESRR